MKLKEGSISVVIVGSWNPGILTPEWIKQNLLELPGDPPIQVGLEIPVGNPLQGHRIIYDDAVFNPTLDKFSIFLRDETLAGLEKLEKFAVSALNLLPHTPVTAVGINVALTDEDPELDKIRKFDLVSPPDEAKVFPAKNQALVWSLDYGECTLNLQESLSEGVHTIGFNFHYATSGAEDAAQKISGHVAENIKKAFQIADAGALQ